MSQDAFYSAMWRYIIADGVDGRTAIVRRLYDVARSLASDGAEFSQAFRTVFADIHGGRSHVRDDCAACAAEQAKMGEPNAT